MRRQAIIWINDGLIYWRTDASLGHDEFIPCFAVTQPHVASLERILYSIVTNDHLHVYRS